MISLELARKLKEAGLEWEPQIGDTFYFKTFKDWGIDTINSEDVNNYLDETRDFIEEGFWILAPRLDQLLAEIEKLGYTWLMQKENICGKYCFSICPINAYNPRWNDFWGNTPTDATAEALLWICDRGADRD